MTSIDFLGPLQQRRSRVSKISDQLKALQRAHHDLEHAIESYRSFVPELEKAKIERLGDRVADLTPKIAEQEASRTYIERRLQATQSAKANPLHIWKFFTAEQKRLRIEADRLRRELSAVKQHLASDQEALSKAREEANKARKRFSEHEDFKLDDAETRFSSLRLEIERIKIDHVAASEELARVEAKIRPHTLEHDRLKSELATLKSDMITANRFDHDLSAASNSYERAMIHQKCEAKFGTGRPQQVISAHGRKIRSIENNLPKLERRIHEELKKSERKIEHLLIDGNNTCYDDNSFIGLRGLTAFLAALDNRYKTTVVFDASIRAMLSTDTQGIKRSLGSAVATHVAPTKTAADEYLLKLADKNENSFILSNDRYTEYHDYDAVKTGRLFRFMIADGKFMATDLDITVDI
jgi:chromosome segregation ATPase